MDRINGMTKMTNAAAALLPPAAVPPPESSWSSCNPVSCRFSDRSQCRLAG